MIRGTTTPFKFKLPCKMSDLMWATITFWQSNNTNPLLPIVKTLEDSDSPTYVSELCITLSAEETLRFSDRLKGRVQFRAQHAGTGEVFGIKPELFNVYPMVDEALDMPTMPVPNEDGWILLDGQDVTTKDSQEWLTLDGHIVVEGDAERSVVFDSKTVMM